MLLAIAPSPTWLAAAWVAVQIPSAIVITTALADGGNPVAPRRRGLTSGLVGAAPIVALLIGGIAVRVLSGSRTWAFVIPALVGALAAAPLMFNSSPSKPVGEVTHSSVDAPTATTRAAMGLWIAFLAGSFLLAWSTATTNGFLVTFVQYVAAVSTDEVPDLSSLAVITAAILATAASITAGPLTAGRILSMRLWIVASALCSVALALLLVAPTVTMLLIATTVFGIAFGTANGVEFSVILLLRRKRERERERERLGRDFGLFTAVTSVPSMLVPTLATALLAKQPADSMVRLFALSCATAAIGAVAVAGAMIHAGSKAPHAVRPTEASPTSIE